MKPIMQFQLKTFSIIVIMVLSGSFKKLECWGTSFVDVIYEDVNALNATCTGLDSCELPRDPDSLEHCSCDRFCSLLGTCCIDSRYRNRYSKPLKNIDCFHIPTRKDKHRYIPMIKSCDPDLKTGIFTEMFCKSNGELLSDPFLKIPVTDPITGISYKNYYCFACNENYGTEEPIPWNIELATKIDKSSATKKKSKARIPRKVGINESSDSSVPTLQYDASWRARVLKVTNSSSVPSLSYDYTRRTWIMNPNQENATDVKFRASFPEQLKNITPICYYMVSPIISECASDWTDDNAKKRCMAYMAVISIRRNYYHNPHCAICNYESMDDLNCFVHLKTFNRPRWQSEVLLLRLFSLQDKAIKTCADFMGYDHFEKKCRRVYRSKRRI
ncbi:uncharacterized protein [Parasteatoda tepidariorum]|uniref:uncharacterized protein isoform X3 n=1 Tax=Parasteatoda tepidariorum TaxID=114398 RepID=UPI001C7190ED|nr:uncharacterized protein LOC122269741 [Parasteatoda tepidariorum]